VSTGAVTQLTSGPGTKSQPAWTPDGRVVYLETLSGTRLRWVDPAQPAALHTIDTGTGGSVGHPAATAP
jgi:Tol biopolymer transport system component